MRMSTERIWNHSCQRAERIYPPRWAGEGLRVGNVIVTGAFLFHRTFVRNVGRKMKTIKGDSRMSEPKETKPAIAGENRTSEQQESKPGMEGLSRREFLGVGSAGLATAALASLVVNAQDRTDTEKAEKDHSARRPDPENEPLCDENPNSKLPPPADHGDFKTVWYAADLSSTRV